MSKTVKTPTALIAAAIALASAAPSYAQTLDKNGRCHDATGRFAKMEVCKPASRASAGDLGLYKLDAKGLCHDAKGRIAKKALCEAKPTH